MKMRLAVTLMCASAVMTAACHKGAPSGQVAATVNGEEITLQELNTEIQASNVPAGADKSVAQQQVLQRVIERKLLAGAARDKKIDKSPEYQSQKLRTDELLLAQTYVKQQVATVPVPTDADISKFMAAHANAFGGREQLQLDQIRFAPPKDRKWLPVIQADHSLDAIAAHLTALGIKFERVKAGLDSGQFPPSGMKSINAVPAGEPFFLPSNGLVTLNVIIGRRPISIDPAQARQGAVGAWRQEKLGQTVGDQLKALRAKANINYQTGFAPKTPTPAPAAPAK